MSSASDGNASLGWMARNESGNNGQGNSNNTDMAGRRSKSNKADGKARDWTDYEMQTILVLICRRVHLQEGGIHAFAAALNDALNRRAPDSLVEGEHEDIDVEDVRVILDWIFREKKAAL